MVQYSGYLYKKPKTTNEEIEKFFERKKKILHLIDSMENIKDTLSKALSLVEYKLKQESKKESSSVLGHP